LGQQIFQQYMWKLLSFCHTACVAGHKTVNNLVPEKLTSQRQVFYTQSFGTVCNLVTTYYAWN